MRTKGHKDVLHKIGANGLCVLEENFGVEEKVHEKPATCKRTKKVGHNHKWCEHNENRVWKGCCPFWVSKRACHANHAMQDHVRVSLCFRTHHPRARGTRPRSRQQRHNVSTRAIDSSRRDLPCTVQPQRGKRTHARAHTQTHAHAHAHAHNQHRKKTKA